MSSRRHQNPDGDQSKSLPWHNALPPWIRSDPAYLKLGQGFRMTLQTIANKCDAPPETGPQTLLVCFGGDQLYEACGCDRRTFQRHLRRLKGLGLVVELSHGSGRQASVYGIPGQRGELDGYQAQARRCGSRPRGWWERADTTRLRQQLADGPPPEVKSKTKLLERQSAALAEGRNTSLEDGQDAAAGAAECHGRGGKMPHYHLLYHHQEPARLIHRRRTERCKFAFMMMMTDRARRPITQRVSQLMNCPSTSSANCRMKPMQRWS